MNNPDFDLVLTDTLLQELSRRFDHFIFSGLTIRVVNQNGTGDNQAVHVWKGCSLTCAGLAAELQNKIIRQRIVTEGEESWVIEEP